MSTFAAVGEKQDETKAALSRIRGMLDDDDALSFAAYLERALAVEKAASAPQLGSGQADVMGPPADAPSIAAAQQPRPAAPLVRCGNAPARAPALPPGRSRSTP